MSAESIANEFAAGQGWNDDTLLALTLTYIDRQGDNDAFGDYLRGIAEEENTSAGDAYDEYLDDEDDDEGDALHDSLHSAAESYASDLNNEGPVHQRAFLLAAGVPAADIDVVVAADPEDGLDSLVIEAASVTASRAYNNDGTAEQVSADLNAIYDPSVSSSSPAANDAVSSYGSDDPDEQTLADADDALRLLADETEAAGDAADGDEDADGEEGFGPYDWTCTYCGSALNENNFDETGSRRCYDDAHSEHLDEGAVAEFEDESHG